MQFYNYSIFPFQLKAIEDSLARNEHIACTNAIVVVNDKGEVTAWFDNQSPVLFYKEK